MEKKNGQSWFWKKSYFCVKRKLKVSPFYPYITHEDTTNSISTLCNFIQLPEICPATREDINKATCLDRIENDATLCKWSHVAFDKAPILLSDLTKNDATCIRKNRLGHPWLDRRLIRAQKIYHSRHQNHFTPAVINVLYHLLLYKAQLIKNEKAKRIDV
jgi:hypothetical protein